MTAFIYSSMTFTHNSIR